MKDEFSSIGEIVKILKGSKASEVFDKPRPGAHPYLQIEDLRPDATPKYAIDKDGTLATKTDVLIAWDGANAGTIGFGLEGYVGSTIAILRPIRDDIHTPYLGYFLRSKFEDIQKNTTGATIPHVSRDYLEELKLPLPPLAEQKRIASLLARADCLRQLRRAARQLTDSLLQSVFLEMFGEPRNNPKKFDLFELGEIVQINPSGRPKANPEQLTSFLPMNLVDPSHIFTDELDVKRFEEVATGYTYFEENDILFAKITPCMENGNIVIAKNLLNGFGFGSTEFHVIRPNKKANAAWLYGFVKRPEFREEATRWFRGTAGQQRVPKEFLESYRVPLPPLPLQEEFARVAARVEGLRARQAEAERQAEELFQALLSESFGG